MIFNRHALTVVRHLRGMSQSGLARSDGRSTSYISDLERGDREKPSLETLVLFGASLECDPRAFYVDPPAQRLIDELDVKLAADVVAIDLLRQIAKRGI